ncbi:hypothetical protein BH11PLA2_BH11PLA2_20190 [soil metagenome]
MSWIIRQMLVVAVVSTLAGTVAAQTTTGTTTGTTSGSSFNGNTQGSGNSGGSGFTNGQEAAPTISGGGASGANVNGTNGFAGYYANPFYQGRPGSTGNDTPGGFGTAMSGSSSGGSNRSATAGGSRSTTGTTNRSSTGTTGSSYGSTGSSTGTTAGRSGTTGSTGSGITGTAIGQGFGGTTGTTGGRTGTTGTTGGFGSTNNRNTGSFGMSGNQQQAGVIVQQPTPIRYAVSVRFPTPAIVPGKMHSDLRESIGRSTFIANPGNVNIAMEGPVVVLRGKVKDEEEARTAEGIVRLTPGVREVRNELEFPKE